MAHSSSGCRPGPAAARAAWRWRWARSVSRWWTNGGYRSNEKFLSAGRRAAGLDLARLIVVRPENTADEQWALDQSLRSPGVAAVWCPLEKCPPRLGRRLQLAAEAGGNLGLLIRPATARGDPSWAEARFLVTPLVATAGRRLRVELLHLRGNAGGRTWDLELDDETGIVRLAPAVAAATVVRHAARG